MPLESIKEMTVGPPGSNVTFIMRSLIEVCPLCILFTLERPSNLADTSCISCMASMPCVFLTNIFYIRMLRLQNRDYRVTLTRKEPDLINSENEVCAQQVFSRASLKWKSLTGKMRWFVCYLGSERARWYKCRASVDLKDAFSTLFAKSEIELECVFPSFQGEGTRVNF